MYFLGFTAISIMFLLTLITSFRWPAVANILFTALILRVFIMITGHYVLELPDTGADAITFERTAWEISKNGFFNLSDSYPGPSAKFLSWVIAIPYSLFGRSLLMAQTFSLFVGVGTVFLGWLIAKKIWNNQIAIG